MANKSRDSIAVADKWRLEDIYADDAAWEAEYAQLEAMLPQLSELKNSIVSSPASLAEGLKAIDKASLLMERLYVYARMRRDENNADSTYQALSTRAQNLSVQLSGALSFLDPLLLSVDDATYDEFLEAPELSEYTFMLENLKRSKPYVLDEKSEHMLSMVGNFAGGAQEIFTMLNNADLRFGEVEHEGKTYPLTHASYIELMQNEDRALRKKVYEKFYEEFEQHINTIAATYGTSVKKDVFYAQVRGYESAMAKALFADNVPEEVYSSLIGAVHDNFDTMHAYVKLRSEILGIADLKMYDIYTPLVGEAKQEYTYEQAQNLVLEGLAPLGEDYLAKLKEAYSAGWIDVYETEGKTSGAYSWGPYGTHPYILLNHRGDLDSVYTLAHELGHAMHSYYSDSTQPYATAGYSIFVAEVASTVNEILLTKHLLATVTDKPMRKYILNHYIDQFRSTVVRQTMFAEFEMLAHGMVERGEALTVESLSDTYGQLNAKYHGPAMGEDDIIKYEWARIPHFYNAFYVYKYATGLSCAVAIVDKLNEPGMKEKYRAFLQAGGSDYPMAILKDAGIDVGEAVDICMKEFAAALEEFAALS